jgi:hypothetical protein
VIAAEHHCESRAFREGEFTQIDFAYIADDTYVVLGRLIGPNGPWDYFVQVYDGEGMRRGGGSWQGPSYERAVEMFEGYCDGARAKAAS